MSSNLPFCGTHDIRLIAHQFPVEILQEIFLSLADLYRDLPPLPLDFPLSSRPDWIVVTHVCRHWRSAALGLLKLWSSISPGLSISWSQVMLERSAPLPMHIDIRIGSCHEDGLEPLAASTLLLRATQSRIRTLRLSGFSCDVLSVLHYLCVPCPLESLNLRMIADGRSMSVDLPGFLFGGEAPYCRRLAFETAVSIQAPRWLLANITHFTTSAGVGLLDVLSTLQGMPQLEVLCINFIITVWPTVGMTTLPLPRAALPRLSLLSVCDWSPYHLVILSSHIDAPPTLRRQFFWAMRYVHDFNYLEDTFTSIQGIIPRGSTLGADGGMRIGRVMGDHKHGSFEIWSRTHTEPASAATRENALFLFNVHWNVPRRPRHIHNCSPRRFCRCAPEPPNPFPHLAVVCKRVRTAHVEDLAVMRLMPEAVIESDYIPGEYVIGEPEQDVAAQWQALLAELPSVKTLRLHRGSPACLSVLRALSACASLLPCLQKVFVVQSIVRYTAAVASPLGSAGIFGSGSGTNVGAELVDVVEARLGLEVVLVGCEVDDEALDALRKRARVVIWDERCKDDACTECATSSKCLPSTWTS